MTMISKEFNIFIKIRIIIAIGYLIFSCLFCLTLSFDSHSVINFPSFIFVIVLSFANLQRNIFIQFLAFLIVFFLVGQTLLGRVFINSDFMRLEQNLQIRFHMLGDALPGTTGTSMFTSDSKGFRTSKPINYGRPSPCRIFAIGGSTTEQGAVDDRSTTYHLLQDWLENELHISVEAVNTGVSGARVINHLATLREIEKYHPSLVIVMLGGNDWNRDIIIHNLPWYKRGLLFTRCLLIGCNTLFRQSPLLTILSRAKNRLMINRLEVDADGVKVIIDHGEYNTSQMNSLARPESVNYWPKTIDSRYHQDLDNFLSRCSKGKYKCLIVSQPTAYQKEASDKIKKLFWMTPPNENYTLSFEDMVHIADLYNRFLASEAKKFGLPFCDAASGIPPSTEFFYDDMHLNGQGAKRLADIIYNCLKSKGIFAYAPSNPSQSGGIMR